MLQKAYSVWSVSQDNEKALMFGFTSGRSFSKAKSISLDMYRAFAVSE